jgi:PAS domain S-box-containing protein
VLAGLVLLVSLVITYFAWSSARRNDEADLAAQFEYRARDFATTTVRRMAVYEQVLRGTRGFMRGRVDLDRRAFADYFQVQNLQEHFPGIEALGVATIIPRERLAAHEAAVRAQGFPDYRVMRDASPAPGSDLYTAITHIEPFAGRNLRAFGFDMYSEPVRRAAMMAARDSGAAAVSGKVVLVQEGRNAQPGFLMYMPVYRAGMPAATVEQRRAAIIGWVYAPFRMADLMRGLGGAHAADLRVAVYDGTRPAPEALLFRSQDASWGQPLFRQTLPLTISGRPWTLEVASSQAFEARRDLRRPRVFAVTGTGLGFLLSLVVWLLASERRRALQLARAMTLELRQSYERNEAERKRMNVILRNTYDAFIAIDAQDRVTDWNPQAATLFGWPEAAALGRPIGDLLVPPEARAAHERGFAQLTRDGAPLVLGEPAEVMARHRDGRLIPVEIVVAALPADVGFGASAFVRDITPRREAEARERLRQARLDEARTALARSQKLEAVGKLTGGVVHDFNNILHIISANVQLLLKSDKNQEKRLRSILEAIERGSKLSAQLLAFARRQPLHPSVVNVGELLARMDSLLHRAAGESVAIELARRDALWNTLVDPNQLENVILNLVINARDAMGGRGKVTITLSNHVVDDAAALADPEIPPGAYVLVAVADTGEGMPPEVMERAFEPFFTTKPEGKGTGLGLSMAHGFVKQSGGQIRIASTPGEGTTISIYLPRHVEEAVTS